MKEVKFELNDGQKIVVDHKGGPLLVVAGAGTGKTRVVVEKINRLLDEGVDPSAIMAVTFTEKAAAEMLERVLLSRAGFVADMAITTFNGFGDRLLREFGVHIGLSGSFKLLSEPARIVFFRERIDQFELDYFLPLSGMPDSVISDILGLFSRLKQNLVSPETYVEFAKTMPAGDEAESYEKLQHQELAGAYLAYTRLCREENVIDYDDQIYLAIRLLEARPNVRKTLQDRYHTLFIDEFQDTNPMQSRLIDLLYSGDTKPFADEAVSVRRRSAQGDVSKYDEPSTGADKPEMSIKPTGSSAVPENTLSGAKGLVVVGDDDQAIYGWRGATLQNILSFKDRYPDAAEAALTVNYRSSQPILDAAYRLIQHNNPFRLEASLGIDKHLTSDCEGEAPVLKRFKDSGQELDWLAADIAARLDGLEADDKVSIAVLTRSNTSAAKVHDALARVGVDHRVVGQSPDLYTRPVVRMLLELTRTLAEPDNGVSLHHTLVSDLFGISNAVVAPLAAKARREHDQLESVLLQSGEPAITEAIGLISTWRDSAANKNVGRLLWQAIDESGYKNRLLKDAPQDDTAAATVHHISQFFDSLAEFESIAVQPTATQYLVSLPALQAAGETTDDTLDIAANEVIVSTVHKAKGLEWDTVYVPKLMDRSFPFLGGGGGLQIPEAFQIASSSPADERLAEERRLMYVAATRARRNLILSYYDLGPSGKAQKPSRFIDELFGPGTAVTADYADVSLLAPSLDIAADSLPARGIPKRIYDGKRVRLSVSQASVLLDCPLNFYYKFVLDAPEAPTSSTTYGSQLHDLFEAINRARQNGSLPPLEDYLTDLSAGWSRAGYVSRVQADRAFGQASATLTRFYNAAASSPPPLHVEETFEIELEPEGIILHGRMDVVLEGENGPEIRDYKTGTSVQTADKAKQRASSQQLTMYALAWAETHDGVVPRVSLEFVDTQLIGGVNKTRRGLDSLRANLAKAVENLKAGQFPPGSYKHDRCIHPPLDEG